MAYVYVISAEPGVHKIGLTEDVKARRSALQTGHYKRLKVEFSLKTDTAAKVERYAHDQLASKRLEGEWFAVDAATAIRAVKLAERSIFWSVRGFIERGERVICVSADRSERNAPRVGKIYTVSDAVEDGWHIDLAELPESRYWWYLGDFMPAPEGKVMHWGIDLTPLAANNRPPIIDPGEVI